MNVPIDGSWRGGSLGPRRHWSGPTVVKFGGSFLGRPDWPALARALAAGADTAAPRTFVVGGGPVVDGLREIDRVLRGDDRLFHDLAIAGMGITARLFAATLGLPLVHRPPRDEGPAAAVLDMAAWIAAEAGRLEGLPASWGVTSDSLAAAVAAGHGDGLLLAKRVPPPAEGLSALATAGWIDPCFPAAARGVPWIGWVAPEE